jgi:3-hydroxyisobutyrate dehydrogenase-like beta-hydroxyacid dehydrogenase
MNMIALYTPRMLERIGFIGLGLMGKPMAANILRAGYPLVVHNRSQGPVTELVGLGADRAASPSDVARRSTCVVTMLPDSSDVASVLEGVDGVLSALPPGSAILDMSSIAPAVARRLAERARSSGIAMLDAPVSGGDIGAKAGTLSIMVGGNAEAFEAVTPLLHVMGNPNRVIRIGEAGAGQLCKLCNQMVIGGTLAAVAEAFALTRRAGVDTARVREALLGGFAGSKVLELHGERILTGNYTPGFKAAHYAKDLRNVVETLASHEVAAPVSAIVQQLASALMAAGRGDEDASALAKTIFDLNDLTDN